MIRVYYFEKYDIRTDKTVRSKRPATLKAIAEIGGKAIMSTAVEVDEADLDGNGFHQNAHSR